MSPWAPLMSALAASVPQKPVVKATSARTSQISAVRWALMPGLFHMAAGVECEALNALPLCWLNALSGT